MKPELGGGNSNIVYFHPENWGRWTHFDEYFSDGLVQPPTSEAMMVSKIGISFFQGLMTSVESSYTFSECHSSEITVQVWKLRGNCIVWSRFFQNMSLCLVCSLIIQASGYLHICGRLLFMLSTIECKYSQSTCSWPSWSCGECVQVIWKAYKKWDRRCRPIVQNFKVHTLKLTWNKTITTKWKGKSSEPYQTFKFWVPHSFNFRGKEVLQFLQSFTPLKTNGWIPKMISGGPRRKF